MIVFLCPNLLISLLRAPTRWSASLTVLWYASLGLSGAGSLATTAQQALTP